MKIAPLVLLPLFILTSPASGRLGETETQIESRYGRMVKSSTGNMKTYEKDGITIVVTAGTLEQTLNGEAMNGKSIKEVFAAAIGNVGPSSLGLKFSDDTILAIMEANKGASEWKEPISTFVESLSVRRYETKDRTREADLYMDGNVEKLSIRLLDASKKATGF